MLFFRQKFKISLRILVRNPGMFCRHVSNPDSNPFKVNLFMFYRAKNA